ncbi:short-chain dehydrogenase reductase 3b-like [Cucurbita pepo subsp. pepo]|uniref:short-chain dehydrogenase reductase 3b-like n=1 Tax=Cucurbita pepo subsp. pepo TaxID=3664 RepID=UPI000C9D8BA9|nr:short-chain dehydrogenase reductase 3b-like [Cucurbita pepo subsp. pepo]
MSKSRRLHGNVALITGAASGIGEETARLFAANGAFVVVADIDDELGRKVAASIGIDQASFHHCDVRDEKQVEETMVGTIKHGARRAMVKKNIRGSIICTASVSATIGGAGPMAYTSSKHAVLGVVRSSSLELGAYGIRVNCVSPHGVATPLARRTLNMEGSKVEELVSASASLKGVVLKASHVAEAALFLASDESAYISGQNLVVDGGFTAVRPVI